MKRRTGRLTVALGLAALLGAWAAGSAIAGGLAIRETNLPNGLRVLIEERHAVPVVSAMIWYRVGSAYEQTGDEGLAHYLEHMLFKGTDRYKKGEIDLITMKNGGANNAFTTEDYTAYYFNFASDRWEQALEIEANRMKKCLFLPKEVESERKVVIEELKRAKDSPWGTLFDEVQSMAFVVHPYHHPVIGFQEQLETVPRDHIFAFYARHYNPVNATLVLVGDLDAQKTLAKVKQIFGKIPRGKKTARIPITEPPQTGEKRVLLRDTGEVPRLLIAYRTTKFHGRHSIVLDVAGHLLSSGKRSRLYQKLVEELKLATSVETANDARRDPGLFQIQVELQAGADIAKAESAVDDEIRRMTQTDATQAELERAGNIASAEFIFEQETASGLATKIGYFDTLADRAFLEGYLEQLRSVGPGELRTVAANYFIPSGRTVGMSLPKGYTAAGAAAKGTGRPAKRMAQRTGVQPAPVPALAGNALRPAGQAALSPATRSGAKSARALDVKRTTLSNGLTLLLMENHALPVVAMRAYVRADNRFEQKGKEGLAEFTGRMLDEGTSTRTADQIAEAIESVGGKLVTDASGARTLVMSKDVDVALELTADVLIEPAFKPDRVTRERARILSEIRGEKDEPNRVALETFRELIYAGHPYHAPRKGYEKSVEAITPSELKAFHAAHYRPGAALLAVVGDFDSKRMAEKVEKAFGRWESKPVPALSLPPLERQTRPVEQTVPVDKEQINVYMGHLGVTRANPDYYALMVMDYVLGTGPGFTDRISKKLRDEKGLAYTVYANISDSASEEPGTFTAYIGTSPENRAKAVEGLLTEIKSLREKGCTASEVANARAYLTGNFVFNFETTSQMADLLVEIERYQLGFDFVERYPKLIDAVTVADVNRVAKQYLNPDAMTLVVVGKAAPDGK